MHADSPPASTGPSIPVASLPSRLRESLGVLRGSIYPDLLRNLRDAVLADNA